MKNKTPKFKENETVIWNGRLATIAFPCRNDREDIEQMYFIHTKPLKVFDEGIGTVSSMTIEGYAEESLLIKIKHSECAESELLDALENGEWYYRVHEQGNPSGHRKHYKTEARAQHFINKNKINLARVEKHLKLK